MAHMLGTFQTLQGSSFHYQDSVNILTKKEFYYRIHKKATFPLTNLGIDRLQHVVRFREKALPEIMEWLEELNGLLPGHHAEVEARRNMAVLFYMMKEVLDAEEANVELSDENREFIVFVKENSDNEEQLQKYSNDLLCHFIKEQMVYFPNTKSVIDAWIITTGDLFDNIILDDAIPMNEMLLV
eukprot:15335109-Ditylum_brightwellii.AAC.1